MLRTSIRYGISLSFLFTLALVGCDPTMPPEMDDAGALRDFGEPCRTTEDCTSGLCLRIPDTERSVCTAACDDGASCPSGWGCIEPDGFSARVCGCASPRAEVCDNRRDDDCNGRVDDCRTCDGMPVPEDSPEHCGTCGNRCANGQECVGGACSCPLGTMLCGGNCLNVETMRERERNVLRGHLRRPSDKRDALRRVQRQLPCRRILRCRCVQLRRGSTRLRGSMCRHPNRHQQLRRVRRDLRSKRSLQRRCLHMPRNQRAQLRWHLHRRLLQPCQLRWMWQRMPHGREVLRLCMPLRWPRLRRRLRSQRRQQLRRMRRHVSRRSVLRRPVVRLPTRHTRMRRNMHADRHQQLQRMRRRLRCGSALSPWRRHVHMRGLGRDVL